MESCSVERSCGADDGAMGESDVELLGRYATGGSEAAFAELVRRHVALVFGSALRRTNNNRALAEEIAQTVFATLARDAARLQSGQALAGWLYVATRHAAANVMRAEARRARREAEVCAMDVIHSSDDAWNQLRPEIEAVLDALEARERDVVLLRFFEGRSFGEIGEALAISEDAARVRTSRALEKLRIRLARRGITSTAAALGGLLATQAAGAVPAGMAASIATAALSGAAVPLAIGASFGASALGVLTFMNTTRIAAGVAVAAAVLATGVSVQALRERGSALAELHAACGEMDALSRALAEARDARRGLEERLATAVPATASRDPGGAAASVQRPAEDELTRALDMQYGSDDYITASQRLERAVFPFQYGQLCRQLGLSPQQVAAFEQALADRSTDMNDVMAAARSQGLSTTDPAVIEMVGSAQTRREATLKSILGTEGYGAFQSYRAIGGVTELNEFLVEAQLQGIPMSSEQVDLLLQQKAAHRSRVKTATSSVRAYDWEAITRDLGSVLSPEQLELLGRFGEMKSALVARTVASSALRKQAADAGPVPSP
ncbi:MAG: sigma-70 family RNA polymerase sigma factor [Opitutaceae bacterium]|nr:sigma-70 family RNA polymerase sigma factor [Opitutaceae bacterium]